MARATSGARAATGRRTRWAELLLDIGKLSWKLSEGCVAGWIDMRGATTRRKVRGIDDYLRALDEASQRRLWEGVLGLHTE